MVESDTLRDWAFLGLLLMPSLQLLALFALLCDNIAPATYLLRRAWSSHAFLGLSIISIFFVTESNQKSQKPWQMGSYTLAGPTSGNVQLHDHLSWAPRWNSLLDRRRIRSLEGHPEETDVQMDDTDTDMEVVIDPIEEDPLPIPIRF